MTLTVTNEVLIRIQSRPSIIERTKRKIKYAGHEMKESNEED